MIVLLVSASWILVLSLVVALCAAARLGDLAHARCASAPASRAREELSAWEPAEDLEIAAYEHVRPVRPAGSGASLVQGGGVAA
jgi:hypothetical protein